MTGVDLCEMAEADLGRRREAVDLEIRLRAMEMAFLGTLLAATQGVTEHLSQSDVYLYWTGRDLETGRVLTKREIRQRIGQATQGDLLDAMIAADAGRAA